eukprot:m.221527 g.221527  ORF g.221527 m.221527 type:complete len:796 (+) comp15128_c0_seq3:117-2504(+)
MGCGASTSTAATALKQDRNCAERVVGTSEQSKVSLSASDLTAVTPTVLTLPSEADVSLEQDRGLSSKASENAPLKPDPCCDHFLANDESGGSDGVVFKRKSEGSSGQVQEQEESSAPQFSSKPSSASAEEQPETAEASLSLEKVEFDSSIVADKDSGSSEQPSLAPTTKIDSALAMCDICPGVSVVDMTVKDKIATDVESPALPTLVKDGESRAIVSPDANSTNNATHELAPEMSEASPAAMQPGAQDVATLLETSAGLMQKSARETKGVINSPTEEHTAQPNQFEAGQEDDTSSKPTVEHSGTLVYLPHKVAGYDDQDQYEAALLKHARSIAGAAKKGDYSNACGGSQAEYETEKDFESVMTQGGGAQDGVQNVFGTLELSDEQLEAGRWLRTLNNQGDCYLYVHTASHEIRGIRPPEYEQPPETGEDESISSGSTLLEIPPSALLTRVVANEFQEYVGQAQQANCLCTIVTKQDELEQTEALLQSCERIKVVDTSALVIPFAKSRKKFPDAIDEIRSELVQGMKQGQLVVLKIITRCPDFRTKVFGNQQYKKMISPSLFSATYDVAAVRSMFVRSKGDGSAKIEKGFSLAFLVIPDAVDELKQQIQSQTSLHSCHLVASPTNPPTLSIQISPQQLQDSLTTAQKNMTCAILHSTNNVQLIDTALEYMDCAFVSVPAIVAADFSSASILSFKQQIAACLENGLLLVLCLKRLPLTTLCKLQAVDPMFNSLFDPALLRARKSDIIAEYSLRDPSTTIIDAGGFGVAVTIEASHNDMPLPPCLQTNCAVVRFVVQS